jgi:preprotein translocase subunit SecG
LTVFWILQAILAVSLITLVSLQSPKGEGLGAIGGTATLFKVQKKREKALRGASLIVAGFFSISSILLLFIH